MRHSMRHITFADAILLTDTRRHKLGFSEIRVLHHEEGNVKVECPRPSHYPLPRDYELASLREPSNPVHGVKTTHILWQEWDAGVLNPWMWNDRDGVTGHIWGDVWISYDYIGAPWPPHHEQGWPPCDGHTNNVGNAGFSLRSLNYCRATADALEHFADDPMVARGCVSSDMHPCRTWRKWLEQERGIKFAPEHIAAKFSCENSVYAGQFGYHGQWTAELNNWCGILAQVRPKGDRKA